MKAIRPEELSALIDGELDAERAREVETQIAADPGLRAEFDMLSGANARWQAAAATAGFTPRVRLAVKSFRSGGVLLAAPLVGGLIFLRAAPKAVESMAFGFGLHALALAILLAALPWLARTSASETGKIR